MVYNHLNERIAALETALCRRVTLNELAASTGLTRDLIHRLRRGKRTGMDADTIDRLCAALGLSSTQELLEYVPDMRKDKDDG